MSTEFDWSYTESEKLFCLDINMCFGDVMAVVADNHVMGIMTMGVVVCTGHISSQTRYLVDESKLFKEFEVSIDGRDIDLCVWLLFD